MSEEKKTLVYTVVSGDQLNLMTESGWQLDRILLEQRVREVTNSVRIGGYYNAANVWVPPHSKVETVHLLVPEKAFLLVKEGGGVIFDLREQLRVCKQQLEAAQANVKDREQSVKKLCDQLNESVRSGNSALDKLQQERDRAQKMEVELGRIRQRLGADRFNDLVREPETSG